MPATASVDELVADQATLGPERPAVLVGDERASYRELMARVGHIQRTLDRARCTGVVAGLFEHGIPAVATLLAAFRSGLVYVPLSPILGRDRVRSTITDCGASIVLTTASLATNVAGLGPGVLLTDDPGDSDSDDLLPRRPAHLAYAIYTSGSTGRPKGVAVSHEALSASTTARLSLYGQGGQLFLTAPLCFDSSMSLLGPLCSGGSVRLSTPGAEGDALRLASEASRDVTQLLILPSLYGQLLEVWREAQPTDLALAIVAGESLVPTLVRRHFALAPARRLVNEYGPTESTVFCTAYECRPEDGRAGSVPIGLPVEGYTVEILDHELRPVRPTEVGEIYVGGAGVAEGYLGDPGLTARRFLPATHGRRYRTGDLGRRRDDGQIEFHGRADDQIKVRGIRVELGEIEATLTNVPGVHEAVATYQEGQVCGFLDVDPGADLDAQMVRRKLLAKVPGHLVPNVIQVLDQLPRTPTGKIDRRTLATATSRSESAAAADLEPVGSAAGPALAAIREAMRVVLGHEPALRSPFVFQGDSLAAMRVAVRLHAIGWLLDPGMLLDGRSPADLAVTMTPALDRPLAPGRLGRLSLNQLGIWFTDQVAGETGAFLIPLRLRVEGVVDEPALRLGLAEVIRRHPVLGCRIDTVGKEPEMVPLEEPVRLRVVDAVDEALLLDEQLALEASQPINLREDPPLRTALVRLGRNRTEILLTLHHIAFDGWSKPVLMRELAAAYGSASTPGTELLTEVPDFRRYAAQSRAMDDAGMYRQDAERAAHQLTGLPAMLDLSFGQSHIRRFWPRGQVVDVEPATRDGLQHLARTCRTTLFVALLAGFTTALEHVSGQTAFVIGSLVAGRPTPEFEDAVGLFANVVPIGISEPASTTASSLVGHVRRAVLAGLGYAHVPFGRVVEAMAPPRTASRAPVAQVLFEYLGEEMEGVDFGGMRARLVDEGLQQGAVSEFSVRVLPRAGGLRCVFVYDSSIVAPSTAADLVGTCLAAWRQLAS